MGGFKKFLIRGNLVDLAVAFVVGASFSGLVKDFTNSFISPLLALFGGKPDYTRLAFKINDTTFPYGVFLTSAIAFIITAAIVYFLVVLPTSKLLDRFSRGQEATERDCPQCLATIPIRARRCQFCTSEVMPGTQVPA
jgi:large conductance mechanosensitive channel